MDNNVPYIVYESEAARHERTVKRPMRLQDVRFRGLQTKWSQCSETLKPLQLLGLTTSKFSI